MPVGVERAASGGSRETSLENKLQEATTAITAERNVQDLCTRR
jgi:hypothetical protein